MPCHSLPGWRCHKWVNFYLFYFFCTGMPSETTMAICSMIFGGVFERFPKLKVCFAHGGNLQYIEEQIMTFSKQWKCELGESKNHPWKIDVWSKVFSLGGSFPFTIGRIEHGFQVRPDLCAVDNKVNPRKYLGSFYTDSLVHDPIALKLLIDVIGKVCSDVSNF